MVGCGVLCSTCAYLDLPSIARLSLRGLMAVAPRGGDPLPAFERLAALADRVRANHPEAVDLSAGMSGDLEAAIAAGANVVRVGTALFGDRPLPFAKIREHQPPESHQ